MELKSMNPHTGKEEGAYPIDTDAEVDHKLQLARKGFAGWKNVPVRERADLIGRTGAILKQNADDFAAMITREMGKPITESKAEITKCAWVCDYYSEHAAQFLADETIATDASRSYVRHDPIGGVLAIMPWNFPFWQVFRFAAPTLTAGNVGLLKHASNVTGCSKLIERVFRDAGYPEGVFQSLVVRHGSIERIIADDAVRAVTLTGSEQAGASVAQIAGRYLKKSLLELGGSNAFIVLADANVEAAVATAVSARMLNCGQSCIAAKRFILVDSIYEQFLARFTEAVRQLRAGDPMDPRTQVGPMAKKEFADDLQAQIGESVRMGAQLLLGGSRKACYHEPTIIGNVRPGMPVFDDETFGPLAAIIKAENEEDAFRLCELSKYGLGVTVCSEDPERVAGLAGKVSDGAYFVNELVKSDPRLPFGGTKRSGYGRELARDGMMEFVNRKTVYVK